MKAKAIFPLLLIILICICISGFVKAINSHLENITLLSCTKEKDSYGSCALVKTNSSSTIVESEFLLLQKDEKVKVKTENDINGRSNINRHENSFEGKDGTKILGSASTEKQYRLILRSKEKTHLLSSSSNQNRLEAQEKRISEFLLNTDNFSLNLLIERSYRLRFYFALILVSFAIIIIGILIAILSFYFLFNPRSLEYKRQNHNLINSTKQLDNKNTGLDLECNKFKQLNTDLYNRSIVRTVF